MAGSVNKVILIGNLGKDPEVRRLNSGDQVVSFSLATTESWKDKTSGERKELTEWHRIVFSPPGRNRRAISEEGIAGLSRRPHPHPQVAGQGRPGPLHHRNRVAAFPRRPDAAQLARRRRGPRQFSRMKAAPAASPARPTAASASRRFRTAEARAAAARGRSTTTFRSIR